MGLKKKLTLWKSYCGVVHYGWV